MCDIVNSFPNDKILNWSKLKAFADENFNIAKTMISVCDTVKNIVGKGENAGYQHFLLLAQCFQKVFFFYFRVVLTRDCVVKS